ncbi:hypothetical protein E2562_028813 [Oryza meyeriana var. granulata]|uniref:UBX domain-containing protein n=1 Tax=Oryza meyeriana var. granulata TaxID=110450 RepID=A0A6G1FD33_9ORYZ|nr:hypothetical protein E2562_028813 [Oryza meyeriana var. granulata]
MTEMEQLTARFVDAVTMRGNPTQDAATPQAAAEEAAAVPRMQMAEGTELEELVARFVDVTVRDGPAQGEAACVVRVRLPDGHVFDKVFGAGRPLLDLVSSPATIAQVREGGNAEFSDLHYCCRSVPA